MNIESVVERLECLDEKLNRIEMLLVQSQGERSVWKSFYSVSEVAELTKSIGFRKYEPYTIRKACAQSRIPEAQKTENGSWHVPREAVLRILEQGFPGEQKN